MTLAVEEPRTEKQAPLGVIAADWWRGLEERKGDRARLRRAVRLLDAALVPATHTLTEALRRQGYFGYGDRDHLLLTAVALANVKEDIGGDSFAALMGRPAANSNRSPVSELRFRRLLETDNPAALVEPIRRILATLGGRAPVGSLAEDLLRWDEKVRQRWAFEYYEVAPEKNNDK